MTTKKKPRKKSPPKKLPEKEPIAVPVDEPVPAKPEEGEATPQVEPIEEPETEPLVPESVPPEPTSEPELIQDVEPPTEEPAPGNTPFTPLPSFRDPRLPEPGTLITRQYKGTVIEVKVLEAGFEFQGSTYSSLSKVAAAASGAKAVNGFAFFKLGGIPGGKARTRTGSVVQLTRKIAKIESLVVRLKVALEEGFQEMHRAEVELQELKDKVDSTTPAD